MKTFKTMLSLILSLSLLLASLPVSAAPQASISEIKLEEDGVLYTIQVSETKTLRTTKLLSEEDECLMTLVFSKERHNLYNPANNATMEIPLSVWEEWKPCSVSSSSIKQNSATSTSAHEYAYTFCQLGQFKYYTWNTTAGAIIQMISVAITVASVFSLIISVIGYSLVSAAYTNAQACARGIKELFNTFLMQYLNTIPVLMNWRSACQEMVEEEGSATGPIYYLGYYPDSTYFFYSIGAED